jgi:hypothetical protein
MRWEYCWLKLAVDIEKTTSVRVIETTRRLEWSALGTQYAIDPEPLASTTTMKVNEAGETSTVPLYRTLYRPEVWGRCLDSLGSNGWELVGITPVSADVRITDLPKSLHGIGRRDVQLWVFKRERDEPTLRLEINEAGDDEYRGSLM